MAKRKGGTNGEGRRANGAGDAAAVASKLPLAPGVKYRRILLKLSGEALMGTSRTSASIRGRCRRSPTR